jgi:hypothetical protein
MRKTVILVTWKLTGRIEAFVNLGKLYSKYSGDILGVSRYTLDRKDIYEGYENEIVKLIKLSIQ